MPRVAVNGVDLHYEIAGTGPPLLFISGTGADLRTRPNVFDGPLAERFQVLAYDQRGLGRSQAPRVAYSMADYADDAAALLDTVGWESAAVMGVSFGGMVAQELVLRHPTVVDRLVLACTSAGGACGSSYPIHELESLAPREHAEAFVGLGDLRRDAAWRAADPKRWEFLVDLALSARREDRDVDGAARQLAARADHDTCDRLGDIDVPVLLVGGRYDGIAPSDNMEAMAARIDGSELSLFEGGHHFLLQDREAFPAIVDWLS